MTDHRSHHDPEVAFEVCESRLRHWPILCRGHIEDEVLHEKRIREPSECLSLLLKCSENLKSLIRSHGVKKKMGCLQSYLASRRVPLLVTVRLITLSKLPLVPPSIMLWRISRAFMV